MTSKAAGGCLVEVLNITPLTATDIPLCQSIPLRAEDFSSSFVLLNGRLITNAGP